MKKEKKCEKAEPANSGNPRDRYRLEHIMLPAFLLGRGGEQVLESVIREQGGYFTALYKRLHWFNRKYQCPYLSEQFQIQEIVKEDALGRTCAMIQVIMPQAEKESQCARVYLCHDGQYNKRRYFTIEKTFVGSFLIGEWVKRNMHTSYEFTPNMRKAEIRKIADLYLDANRFMALK